MATTIDKLLIEILGDSTDYLKALQQAVGHTNSFVKQIESMSKLINQAIVEPLRDLGRSAVSTFANFDQEMTKSTSIMEVTTDEIKAMGDAAIEMSRSSTFGAAEIAKAYYHLASAHLNAQQSMKAMPAIINFAQAGVMELHTAARLATTSVMALGMASKDSNQYLANTTRVTNLLVKVSKMAEANTEQFAIALTRDAASTMRTYNMTLEEGIALLGAYAKQNTVASFGGNTFGRMIRLVTSAATKHAKEFERAGIAVFDPKTHNLLPVLTLLENFEKRLGKLNDQGRVTALNALGIPALTQKAIIPLIGLSSEFKIMQDALIKTGDIGKEISDKQLASFSNQMLILKHNVEAVGIEIGQYLAPYIKMLGEAVKAATDFWKGMDAETKKTIVGLGAILTIVIPVTLGIITLVKFFVAGFKAIVAVLGGAKVLLAAIFLLIGPLASMGENMGDGFKGVEGTFRAVWESVKQIFGDFIAWATPVWGAFTMFLGVAFEHLVNASSIAAEFLIGLFNSFLSFIGLGQTSAQDLQMTLINFFADSESLLQNWPTIWEMMMIKIKLMWLTFIEDLKLGIWNLGIQITNALGSVIGREQMPQIARVLSEEEKDVKKKLDDINGLLAGNFANTRQKYMDKLLGDDKGMDKSPFDGFLGDDSPEAENRGKKDGEDYAKAFKQQSSSVDNTLFGSQESLRRIAAFKDAMNPQMGLAKGSDARYENVLSDSQEAARRQEKQTNLLEQIRDGVRNGLRPNVQTADVG